MWTRAFSLKRGGREDKTSEAIAVVHVGDMVLLAAEGVRNEIVKKLREHYDLKHVHDLKKEGDTAELLGRTLLRTRRGYALYNDAKYAEEVAALVGLRPGSKPVTTPAAPEDGKGDATPIDEERAAAYRSAVGMPLWAANDRPDLKYTAGRLASAVSQPTVEQWEMLKRCARYFLGAPVGVVTLEPRGAGVGLYLPRNEEKFDYDPAAWDPDASHGASVKVFSDSDWGGCRRTRRSVTGGAL